MSKIKGRRDARLIKNISPMHKIMVRIKPERCDSDVYINEKVDVTNLIEYMDNLKKENPSDHPTLFHAFCYAIARTIFLRPKLNRYIIGGKTYERYDVSLGFVCKTKFEDHAEELMTLIKMDPNFKLNDLKDEIKKHVKQIRGTNDKKSTDKTVALVASMPDFVQNIVVSVFKFLDRHDLLPQKMCDTLLYYSSVIVSDIGSFDCDGIYHNITNFGTNSILVTIGAVRKKYVLNDKGEAEERYVTTLGVTLDERIADGYYFIKSIKLLEKILENPELLEEKISDELDGE